MTTTAPFQGRESHVRPVDGTCENATYTPSVDILENPEEMLLVADVPGAKADDIALQFENGELRIHARVAPRLPEPGKSYLFCEYGVGDYQRRFRIGEDIDVDRIRAEVSAGVLKVHLPKSENAKPRKISVRSV